MTTARDRLMELLTDRALVGLGAREQIELAELLVQVQDVDPAAFDKAAAAVALAGLGEIEEIPAALSDKLLDSAMKMTDLRTSRPASDFASTREIDKLSPGFARTQADVEGVTALDAGAPKVSSEHKKTVTMEDRPFMPPDSLPLSFPTQVGPSQAPALAPNSPRPLAPHVPPASKATLPHLVTPSPPGAVAPPFASAPPIASAPPLASAPPVASGRPYGSGAMPASAGLGYVPGAVPSSGNVVPFPAARAPSRAVAISGWLAAAACLLLAIGAFAWRTTSGPVATIPTTPPAPSLTTPPSASIPAPPPTAVAAQSPAELREKLLAAAGTTRAEWSATKDPAGKAATGEVVWNKDQQQGVMRFKGLAKNDPTRAQYQLWIFDKTRDEKYPVDGGVFDVDSETGDVIVAIKATLPVSAPQLFAVTLEKPGGVVVSKRERIVVTAKLPAG